MISEGLSGRNATIESPVAEGRNGLPYLVPCLRSHAPVDVLVIFLGTNDAYWLEPLLVALSIISGARDFTAADNTSAVFVAAHDLVPGQHLGPDDLVIGHVRLQGQASRYIAANECRLRRRAASGTIHPILGRLEGLGWLESHWEDIMPPAVRGEEP